MNILSVTHKKIYGFLLFLFIGAQTFAQDSSDDIKPYLTDNDLPNGELFLQTPPDSSELNYVDDFTQWIWGKSKRKTDRGKQATLDGQYGINRQATIYGDLLYLSINKTNTPAIWNLFERITATCSYISSHVKQKFGRVRPFVQMHEHLYGSLESESRVAQTFSYPSGHTVLGWITAMAMAEVAPKSQNGIMRKGYEYGESRVIVGAHWQSDVEAGRLLASAAYARLRGNAEFASDLMAAKNEYETKMGIPAPATVPTPGLKQILGAPIDSLSYRYYDDVVKYWQAKKLRNTKRGQTAIKDADYSKESLLKNFSNDIGFELSTKKTPNIVKLFNHVWQKLLDGSSTMKALYFRRRPYIQFDENSAIPDSETTSSNSSSYPSCHSMLGWGMSLFLTELMPEYQNQIIIRGYEIGESNVITGYNFSSDVQAARLMAAAIFSQIQSDETFKQLYPKAVEEYKKIKPESTDIEELIVNQDDNHEDPPSFDVNGRRVNSIQKNNIYIIDGKKRIIK